MIAKPLFGLTENGTKFVWSQACREAFDALKQVLISSPVLSFPVEGGEFILDTDASNHGIGVLSQSQDGQEKVIANFSRVLSKAERNYCVTRRELLAIVSSVKSFHHYLYGRKFLVRTDHVALRWLMYFRELEGQLARWLERLQQYEFEILHRKGLSHQNATACRGALVWRIVAVTVQKLSPRKPRWRRGCWHVLFCLMTFRRSGGETSWRIR